MNIKKWCKTGLKVFASALTIFSIFTGTVHAQDKYTLNVQVPYGLTTNKSYKWATGFTQPVNNGYDSDVYAKLSINGQKVYCIDPLRAAIHGAGDYSPQDLGTYTGSKEKSERLAWISALGYGFNGDTSDEMDYATQIRIWQEVRPGLVTDIHPDIQAKINQINERLRVYDIPVSFHKADITLYGYGKEYGQTLIDSNGVFSNYKLTDIQGIHCEQIGNQLMVWAEKGDSANGGLMFKLYGFDNSGTSLAYVSPSSQNVVMLKGKDPRTVRVRTKLITGSIKVEKQDKETKEQAQGLGSLDSASYDVIRDDTGENMGTLTWEAGKGSNEINGLYIRLPDGKTPITYTLKETKAPTGYHLGNFTEGTLDGNIPFGFDSNNADENGIVHLTVTGEDSVSKIQLNKVDSKGNPVKGATLQLLDGETNKKVKFNYNETDSDDQKVWVTDGKPLEVRGLKVGHEYILQEIHAPNGVELARDVHFTVEGNQEIQIVKMVDENEAPLMGTKAFIGGKKTISPKDEVVLKDEITYKNFEKGTYKVETTIMDKETGEAIEGLKQTTKVDIQKMDGEFVVEMKVNSDKIAGKDLVVFEKVFDKDGNLYVSHEDLEDENQTVTVKPHDYKIGTTATIDGEKEIAPKGEVELKDVVEYENFPPATYKFVGTIIDKMTGKEIEGLTVEKEIELTERSGSVEITFTVDSDKLAGKDLVVFEKVYDMEGNLLTSHEDLEDEGQTVTINFPPTTPPVDTATNMAETSMKALLMSSALVGFGMMIYRLTHDRKERK